MQNITNQIKHTMNRTPKSYSVKHDGKKFHINTTSSHIKMKRNIDETYMHIVHACVCAGVYKQQSKGEIKSNYALFVCV